jgi:hypothetical protein
MRNKKGLLQDLKDMYKSILENKKREDIGLSHLEIQFNFLLAMYYEMATYKEKSELEQAFNRISKKTKGKEL